LVPLVLLATLVSPGSRNFFVYDVMGFRESVSPPTVGSVDLFLRQGKGATRVDVVIRNDTARQEIVTEIAVDVVIFDGVMCSDSFLYQYTLRDSIDVAIGSAGAKFVGEVVELGDDEYQLPVEGSLNEVCGFISYDFVFRPIIELAPKDVSAFAIELPSQFEARRIELHEGDIESTEAALDKPHTIDVRLPTNTLSDTAARIMVTVNLSGLPSPEQLCRIEGNSDLRDGLRSCPD
jgi:hypothetical protein